MRDRLRVMARPRKTARIDSTIVKTAVTTDRTQFPSGVTTDRTRSLTGATTSPTIVSIAVITLPTIGRIASTMSATDNPHASIGAPKFGSKFVGIHRVAIFGEAIAMLQDTVGIVLIAGPRGDRWQAGSRGDGMNQSPTTMGTTYTSRATPYTSGKRLSRPSKITASKRTRLQRPPRRSHPMMPANGYRLESLR